MLMSILKNSQLQKKLYVLIRDDLKKSHKAVQAGHVIADYVSWQNLKYDSYYDYEYYWDNGTLVYLDIKKEDLDYWIQLLDLNNLFYVKYTEEYYNNITTAIAVYCDGSIFKDLNLAEF